MDVKLKALFQFLGVNIEDSNGRLSGGLGVGLGISGGLGRGLGIAALEGERERERERRLGGRWGLGNS